MDNPPRTTPGPQPDEGKPTDAHGSPTPLPDGATSNPAATEPAAPKLSKEEQMAQYEEHLKETDWGHQPC